MVETGGTHARHQGRVDVGDVARCHPALGRSAPAVSHVAPDVLSYYLAEGATGGFFDVDIAIANPNDTDAPVTLTFLQEGGRALYAAVTRRECRRRLEQCVDCSGSRAAC